jgi:hypothetical protein
MFFKFEHVGKKVWLLLNASILCISIFLPFEAVIGDIVSAAQIIKVVLLGHFFILLPLILPVLFAIIYFIISIITFKSKQKELAKKVILGLVFISLTFHTLVVVLVLYSGIWRLHEGFWLLWLSVISSLVYEFNYRVISSNK